MFRFTIRDLLWLTVVVGLGVGWWDASAKQQCSKEEAAQSKEDLNDLIAHMRRHGWIVQNDRTGRPALSWPTRGSILSTSANPPSE